MLVIRQRAGMAGVRRDRSFPLASFQVANGHAGRNGRDFGETDATGPIAISSAFTASRRRCDRSRVGGWAPLGARRLAKRPASPDGTRERSCFVRPLSSHPLSPQVDLLPRRPDPGARSARVGAQAGRGAHVQDRRPVELADLHGQPGIGPNRAVSQRGHGASGRRKGHAQAQIPAEQINTLPNRFRQMRRGRRCRS